MASNAIRLSPKNIWYKAMWANYEFKTQNTYNELRGIIKQYNEFISIKEHLPKWKIKKIRALSIWYFVGQTSQMG